MEILIFVEIHILPKIWACAKENTQLLISANTASSDAAIEIRGKRYASTSNKHSQLHHK